MGRSVSTPRNASHVVYAHRVYREDDDDGFLEQQDFDDAIEDLRAEIRAKDKSFRNISQWSGEDHGLLVNDAYTIGVSEYCGLVAVWAVPKTWHEDEEGDTSIVNDILEHNLEAWLIEAAGYFGEVLRKVGTFSNGEAVFERRAA